MAVLLCGLTKFASQIFRGLHLKELKLEALGVSCLLPEKQGLLYREQVRTNISVSSGSVLVHLSADKLWKGVTTVSSAGRKKGRGRGTGRRIAKDLNRGQNIGVGNINMVWPGLNTPILRGKEVIQQQQLPEDKERQDKLLKLRNLQKSIRPLYVDSLERGFSGTKWPGRSCGPPESKKEGEFEGFDTKVLEMRGRSVMSSKFGRIRQVTVVVVTGNKNGLAGFAHVVGKDGFAAIKKARTKAATTLRYVERYEGHTVCHDFHSKYNETELFVKAKPKGYGLVCHRVLKVICEMIGITDLYIRVEGSTNPYMLTCAFFLGLEQQKTPQELADIMRLNVVEFRQECDYFPRLIAAPQTGCRTREEIPSDEITDYDEFTSEGRLEKPHVRKQPFYVALPSYAKGQKKIAFRRNLDPVRHRIIAEYGAPKSFYHLKEEERLRNQQVAQVTNE